MHPQSLRPAQDLTTNTPVRIPTGKFLKASAVTKKVTNKLISKQK